MNPVNHILELFDILPLSEKEQIVRRMNRIIEKERQSPPSTFLQNAWQDIQRNIAYLSYEPYIDDQVQIEMIWETCDEIVNSKILSKESWDTRQSVLLDIIKNDYYDYYGCYDPMHDLLPALLFTQDEMLWAAQEMYDGEGSVIMDGARLFMKCGQPNKYYDLIETRLGRNKEPYLELINYYKDSDEQKATSIANIGLKKCQEDQTDIMLYLLKVARNHGDEQTFSRLMRSAKQRRLVNDRKVEAAFN